MIIEVRLRRRVPDPGRCLVPGWRASVSAWTLRRRRARGRAAGRSAVPAVPIEAGQYRITLSYVTHYLGVGVCISVVGVIALWLYVWRWRDGFRS